MDKDTNKRFDKAWGIAFIIYFALLLTIITLAYLRLIPVEIGAIPYYDTIGHFVLYGITGYLAYRGLNRRMIKFLGLPIPLGPSVIMAFAVVEESLQALSPYRTFSLEDLSANFAGILLLYFADRIYLRRKSK